MKITYGGVPTTSYFHKIGGVVFALASVSAPLSFASQSSIDQRASFNSDRQLGMITSGSWGIDEKSFANGALTFTKTPTTSLASSYDTFYQLNLGVGYAIHNIAFDVGFQYSKSPLTEVRSLGGSFGVTYIFTPQGANDDDYQEEALASFHAQTFHKTHEQPPLFWLRLGYIGNTMKTEALPLANSSGRETALAIDAFYPFNDELLFILGAGFHGYDNSRGFYDKALANANTAEQQLLQSTLQGLPHTNYSLSASYQLTQSEALMPRYQATEIDSSRQWSHTVDLAWRHEISKSWYLTPNYELTITQATSSTGVILDLLFIF